LDKRRIWWGTKAYTMGNNNLSEGKKTAYTEENNDVDNGEQEPIQRERIT
jgi:hypothetical protein